MKENHLTKDVTLSSRAAANDSSGRDGISMPAVPALAHSKPVQFVQPDVRTNNTGLPDQLKDGVENISGISLDDVKVHYNSDKPAEVNALAFAQGTDIHVSPGQEKHLPHEAWHIVQQKQGRVKPTSQMNGLPVNTDISLEKEADMLGTQALQRKESSGRPLQNVHNNDKPVLQGFWQFLFTSVAKESAREIGLRLIKGKVAEQLAGIENEVLKGVIEAMQNNAELRNALQNVHLMSNLQSAAERMAAPLAEKMRTTISDALDSIVDQFPDLKNEIESYKASLAQKINENKVVLALKGTVEIIAATASQIGAHLAIHKGFDLVGKKAMGQALAVGKEVVKENVDQITKITKDVLDNAEVLEKAADTLDDLIVPLKMIRKPIRYGVKTTMDAIEDVSGLGTEASKKLRDVSSVGGLKDVLAETADDVAEKATGTIKESAATTSGGQMVKYGASALQAAFILSDIAKAKTFTESTIALLKPVVALSGALVSGPAAPIVAVSAPIMLEQILKKLESKIEPQLLNANQYILTNAPLINQLASTGYQSAAFLGHGINAIPSTLASAAAGLYHGTIGLIFQGNPSPSTENVKPTDVSQSALNTQVQVNIDIHQIVADAINNAVAPAQTNSSKMEDVD